MLFLFTLLDLLSIIGISFVQFHWQIHFLLVLLISAYLISKAFMFKDIMSLIDAIVGIYLILSFAFGGGVLVIYFLVLGWFLYKLFLPIIFNN
jgi:hypothetical protein